MYDSNTFSGGMAKNILSETASNGLVWRAWPHSFKVHFTEFWDRLVKMEQGEQRCYLFLAWQRSYLLPSAQQEEPLPQHSPPGHTLWPCHPTPQPNSDQTHSQGWFHCKGTGARHCCLSCLCGETHKGEPFSPFLILYSGFWNYFWNLFAVFLFITYFKML